MLYSFNVFCSSSKRWSHQVTEHRDCLTVPHTTAWPSLTIDLRWDKPGDLVTAAGFDETLHYVLENLVRSVWARGFFPILVFICWVTEVKLSLFDYLKLLAVEIICALAAVQWVVSSFESVVGSKEVTLHSTLKQKTEHTGQKRHHSLTQKLPSARRNPLLRW